MNFSDETIVVQNKVEIMNCLPEIGKQAVVNEIIAGLKDSPKHIASKYFYDEAGSRLFEDITKLDAYYPTLTEKAILGSLWDKLALEFDALNIVELGSGDASKIRLLIEQIPKYLLPQITYIPIDISLDALEWAAEELTQQFPEMDIQGFAADFLLDLSMIPKEKKRLFCFLGSTIGNFNPDETHRFLQMLGQEMQPGDSLLLGMDMVKDVDLIEKAYNDAQGVTEQFNKNILHVVNRLVGADFRPEYFDHLAFYNRNKNRIEMHLRAQKEMVVHLKATGETIRLHSGQTIHTENSHKFTPNDIAKFGQWAGLQTKAVFNDSRGYFSLAYYEKEN